jgi:hypothetical protein
MHVLASSTGVLPRIDSAPVGQASKHFVQEPQEPTAGASDSKSRDSKRLAMKNQLPFREWMIQVFFPNHPKPALWAKSRSKVGAESTQIRHCKPGNSF